MASCGGTVHKRRLCGPQHAGERFLGGFRSFGRLVALLPPRDSLRLPAGAHGPRARTRNVPGPRGPLLQDRTPSLVSQMNYERELEFAIRMAAAAGGNARRIRSGGISAERKADASPVTVADKDNERLIREANEREFPND